MSQEDEGAEEPEALDPHQLVVASGEETELEYNYTASLLLPLPSIVAQWWLSLRWTTSCW
jgi:hypothetical protein